ncbi:MAG: hypothetical protein H6707_11920 [Deltaproteobacteria bacterium]|nr:hypothetical protein [Deltaproteobacteria bacterium]
MSAIFVCAGELSGDRYVAPVVRELRRRLSDWRFWGVGSACLAKQQVALVCRAEQLAATGTLDAARRGPAFVQALLRLKRAIAADPPRLALLVDAPTLNMRLIGWLRASGVPIVYFLAPQRWAWRPSATAALRAVDRLAVALPFEQSWFARHGVATTFVGHPLVDRRVPTNIQPRVGKAPLIAIFPGSRDNETRRHLPLFCAALAELQRTTDARGVVGIASAAHGQLCRQLAPQLEQCEAWRLMHQADLGLAASGSVTLETALAGLPTVVCYRTSPLTAWLGQRLVGVPWLSLPNLLLGRPLLPEFVQQQATPVALARALRTLGHAEVASAVRLQLLKVRPLLGEPGVAGRVAQLALERLGLDKAAD